MDIEFKITRSSIENRNYSNGWIGLRSQSLERLCETYGEFRKRIEGWTCFKNHGSFAVQGYRRHSVGQEMEDDSWFTGEDIKQFWVKEVIIDDDGKELEIDT